MALVGKKRRKIEHVSSDEDDDASFASFGDEPDELEATEDGVPGEEADADEDEDVGGDEAVSLDTEKDESEEDGEISSVAGSAHIQSKATKHEGTHRDVRKTAASTRKTSEGVYMAGTSKSNVFNLQVDELLGQIRLRQSKRGGSAEEALHTLKRTLDKASARSPLPIEQAERELTTKHKVAAPFPEPRPPKDAKYKLEFAEPASINVVGSFALKTANRSREVLSVDMMVTMPANLFQEKDYLNHRYFYKRAYYLACLAVDLKQKHSAEYDICFEDFHGDQLKPVLIMTPKPQQVNAAAPKPASKWQINILPCVGIDVFPPDKLSPDRNCVRPTADATPQPTPLYNSSLRVDMLLSSYLKLLHSAAGTCEALRDACLLGSAWLRQRGYGSNFSSGGFGNFEWSCLMALLLQGGGPNGKPMLSPGYSCYQLFKATLQILAMKDLSKHSFVVGDHDIKPIGDGSPMVWDAARSHNVLYRVTPWAYAQLRKDAKATLNTLGDQLYDGFDATFITRVDNPLLRYDYVIELPAAALGPDGSCKKLYDVLRQGLGDRVTQISIQPPPAPPWQLGSARSLTHRRATVKVGVAVNPDVSGRTVDHGPLAESKAETATFRKFWGEKAELRRFRDGSILETLLWTPNEGGRSILEQVVRYVLQRHIGSDAEAQAQFVGSGFPKLLRNSMTLAHFQPLIEAYKQMEVDIRSLDGLPLSVRQIMPADAQLRYASVQTPLGTAGQARASPANVTIQFEGSARWPDDLVAIQRTKIAFLLKVSEQLQEANSSVTARIGLEHQESDILNQVFLDIVYDSGAAFRMRIHHDREQTLLERQLKDKSAAPSAKDAAALGLAVYKRDYLRAPLHTQAVARLCSRHQALSGTIRLLKKWFASHLLANHIAEEIIELMAIRTFSQPWPWNIPSSIQTGFLRTLHWLARWDWRTEPLIVDTSGSGGLKQPDHQAIRTRFDAWRKLDPSLNRIVLFAASNVDTDGTTWTDGKPQRVIAGRMTALAKAACAEIDETLLELEPASLFTSPLSDYDFVLHLNDLGRKRKAATNDMTFKNLAMEEESDETLVGFDPHAFFLAELEELYGSAVLFFSGGKERPVIAGLWSPQTVERTWKVNLAYSTVPKKVAKTDDVSAAVNKESMLAEMARLGSDLIETVETNR